MMHRTKQKSTVWILVSIALLLLCTQAIAAEQDNDGFLYGRVITESGSEYTGFLRWGNQEAFWDDLFHSGKEDLPFMDYLDDLDRRSSKRKRGSRFNFFKKWTITIDGDEYGESRMFICRFGDITKIEPRGDGDAVLKMRNGKRYDVSGVADDVTSDIHVNDESLGKIDLHWDRIESIEFLPAPRSADPGVWRLYGTVETNDGDFEGYIQWDKQECINTDILDGESRDGDIEIEMGRIRSIESAGRRGSLVVLQDGRELKLRGTNDVNRENRGIMVEDPRFGRVTVHWDAFDRITFSKPSGSGNGYNDYPERGGLYGTVTDEDGDTYKGQIIFDLDESEGWEMLNGDIDDIEYDIEFYRIASIEPLGGDECRVVLVNGEKLVFDDGHDVTDDNAGVLILVGGDDDDPVYVSWDEIEIIEFDHKS